MKTYLIGFMGCGKSYLGQQWAKERGMNFIDLDEMIEKETGESISKIFETRGEAHFREIEREALRQTDQLDNVMIACGGGTACFSDNMQWMKQHGETIYIQAEIAVLFDRLLVEKNKRPLINHMTDEALMDYICSTLHTREHFYLQADKVWKSC